MNDSPSCAGSNAVFYGLQGQGNTLILPVAEQKIYRMRFQNEEEHAAQAIGPAEAVIALEERGKEVKTICLDGPGDTLATPEITLALIDTLHRTAPECSIALTTLGLSGDTLAAKLANAGLKQAIILVDAIYKDTADKLYQWIRPGKKNMLLDKAIPFLLEQQLQTVQAFSAVGIKVTIRTTLYPGINAHQAVNIAEVMKDAGASLMELIAFLPSPEQSDAPPPATRVHMEEISKLTEKYLPTVSYLPDPGTCGCGCTPSSGCQPQICGCGLDTTTIAQPNLPKPSKERSRVAVASSNGMEVDLHLGQTKVFLIYGPREKDALPCLLETRQAPPSGGGDERWEKLGGILRDCCALLVASAGTRPKEILTALGLRVIVGENEINGAVDLLYGGGKKKGCKQ